MEAAGSLDTLGLIARSIEDIALYRDVLLGATPEALAPETGAQRIGFCRTHLWPIIEPSTQRLLEDAAKRLAQRGAKVTEVTLPDEFERLMDAHRWISSFEFARNFTWEIDHHWERISERLRNGRLKDGLSCPFERYREARAFAARCRRAFADLMGECDVLLTAAATGEAPLGLESTGNAAPSTLWTTLHVPCVTLPAFKGPAGLPVGAQLIARRNDDRRLFAAARWADRHLT
jgi:amidase